MKKQLISFDSPPEYPSYCEAIDCEHFCLVNGCLVGKEELECALEANEKVYWWRDLLGKGEKIRDLIRRKNGNL